jgi:hypothetical protein
MSLATNPGLMSVTVTPESDSSGVIASASARSANLLIAYGDAFGEDGPSRDAADNDDVAPGLFDVGQGGLDRAQHAEHVGFELASIVVHRQVAYRADDAKTCVRDDDVQASPAARRIGDRAFHVAVARHVAAGDERRRCAGRSDALREGLEHLDAARRQRQLRPGLTELPRELLADPGRGARDQDALPLKERSWRSSSPVEIDRGAGPDPRQRELREAVGQRDSPGGAAPMPSTYGVAAGVRAAQPHAQASISRPP